MERIAKCRAMFPIAAPLEMQLNWTAAEMAATARGCNGCGVCRAQSSDLRMCPIFRANPAEEAFAARQRPT